MNAEIKTRIEMINKGEVPEGYKETKVGIIPEDWEETRLDKVSKITMGQSPSSANYNENGIGLPLIQGNADIKDRYTSPRLFTSEITKICEVDDIIMSVRAPVGEIAKSVHKACIGRGVCSIRPVENNYYLYHYLINSERLWTRYSQGSTFESVNSSDIKKFKVISPKSIKEQQKIAQILSTWDEAIELKEKLIEEKKEQKKGLMQKLLTGEVRLSGFDGEWEEVRLGEVLKERKETGYNNLELLAITSDKGIVRRDEIDLKDTSSNDKSKYKRIIPLDIGYNTMRMWQGVSGVSEYEGIVSPAYTILKPTCKVDSYFMGYLFKVPEIINLFKRYSQGLVNDTLNLKYSNFKIIKVKIPKSLQEQKAIAQILTTADKEIELLTQELEQLKLQKKGLMQLLLTGIIRVKS